jgi:hypothetical protein
MVLGCTSNLRWANEERRSVMNMKRLLRAICCGLVIIGLAGCPFERNDPEKAAQATETAK